MCGKKFSCGYYDNNILRNRLENVSLRTHTQHIHIAADNHIVFIVSPLQVLGLTGGLQGHGHRSADDAGVEGAADPGVQSGEEA